jgi:hypothetical protein
MLTTKQDHALPPFPFLCEPGSTAWRAVTFDIAIPYLLLTYAIKQGPGWLAETSILWQNEDVLALCKEVEADHLRKMLEVAVLLPTSDGRHSWRLETVQKIFASKPSVQPRPVVTYLTERGERFGGNSSMTNEEYDALDQLELIYAAK